MKDTINRQQAIDATRNATFSFTIKSDIDFANYRKEIQEIFNNVLDAQEKALNELPSVQPERKTGTCDECIHKYRFDYEPPCKMCIRIASKGRDGDYFCKDGDDNEML